MEVEINLVISDIIAPCRLIDGYQSFGGKYRLHFQGTETYSLYLHKEDSPETGGNIFF